MIKVVWLKDGASVDLDRALTSFKDGVASLEIYNMRLEDGGNYKCWASNKFGEDVSAIPISAICTLPAPNTVRE